ncbi:TetR/AcrR family transcriptional regulator [Micromonospora sp. DT47]|uniref:TetR/AcrR family transcriptional regulator n=1 Tax=Micromonospora sp. DT47 TaxID=3393431 RepID=UPI003CF4BF93
MAPGQAASRRTPLNRDRMLARAVALADEEGIESVSMRRLSQELGVVPMALYKHVANKDELLDGMVDMVVAEIDAPDPDLDWRSAVRARILSARRVLLRHPWARRVMESRTKPTPAVLTYMDSTIAMFVAGGLSIDLTHHVMHALGSRIFGFTQELYDDPKNADGMSEAAARQMAETYPHIAAVATSRRHDTASVVGSGCDDQFEFEFTLGLLLDGVERLHRQGWSSSQKPTEAPLR